jgi:hypothetical protein
MLSEHRDDHGGIFRPLAFVNGRRDSALKVVPPSPMSSIRTSYWCEFARSRRRCVSPEFKKFSSVGGEQTMPPGVATARGRRLGAPE